MQLSLALDNFQPALDEIQFTAVAAGRSWQNASAMAEIEPERNARRLGELSREQRIRHAIEANGCLRQFGRLRVMRNEVVAVSIDLPVPCYIHKNRLIRGLLDSKIVLIASRIAVRHCAAVDEFLDLVS